MENLYHTLLVSDRHKKLGYCETSDFGKIALNELSEEEAPLICTIKDFQEIDNLRLFRGNYYTDNYTHMSSSICAKDIFKRKQGRLTPTKAIELMITLRYKSEGSFSYVPNYEYALINKHLYVKLCSKGRLVISQCGNILFGDWWSLDVETSNVNKRYVRFNKKNFDYELEEAKKWIDEKNKGRNESIHFTYPSIKWNGDNYKLIE